MTLKRNATTTLITVICAFYLLQLIHPSIEQDLFLIRKAGFADGLYHGVQTGEWYRIITVALIHGGLMHLAFNMYALLVLGNPLEYAFGKVKFLSIFFISLITGSLASLWLNPSNVAIRWSLRCALWFIWRLRSSRKKNRRRCKKHSGLDWD